MKRKLLLLISFFLFTINIFSEEWISERGQKLIFINQTAIIFKENSLDDIGPKINNWKNAIMSLSINNEGNALCDIIVSPDNYDIAVATNWIPYMYSWFYSHIENEKQQRAFMSIGFIVRFRTEFSRGAIEQYGALRRSGYVKFYDDMHFESGPYKADSNDFSWLYPKYNEVSQSWNSGYIYYYIIGDFERIMDMPVPPGLDASFKTDIPNIPNIIEKQDWVKFNSLVKKYDLKLSKYLNKLFEYNAPSSVFSNFSYDELQEQDYKEYVKNICSNIKQLIFFYQYFDKSELEIVKQYFTDNPDVYVDFCKTAQVEFSSLDPSLPEYFVIKCSLENVNYITRSYDINTVAPVLSKLEKDRIEQILKDRTDIVSEFLKFYYLNFESVTVDKLLTYMNKLEINQSDFFTTCIYNIDKTLAEKLTDNQYSSVLKELFKKEIFKIQIINSNILKIYTDYDKSGIFIIDYKKSEVLTNVIKQPLFEIAYKLYTNEIPVENIFSPNSQIIDNCKFELEFDNGEIYSESKKKTGTYVFGELKNGKISKKDITILNNQNETLLFSAIRNGNDAFAQQLIKDGIDVNVTNSEGKKALDIANEVGNIKLQKILLKK